ncbi:hypothetical protein B0J12DRAFT_321738 [Macrophomina phaseolina]|uniref:Secreted protein n=1 Tax=Macrophomina phaseolina TaxID=35725 RepID=A0ABQ8FYK0_9PEZI|nr:hypothetical protein B0J12DRAFT_321738 [Macrophomina phaseolina]
MIFWLSHAIFAQTLYLLQTQSHFVKKHSRTASQILSQSWMTPPSGIRGQASRSRILPVAPLLARWAVTRPFYACFSNMTLPMGSSIVGNFPRIMLSHQLNPLSYLQR